MLIPLCRNQVERLANRMAETYYHVLYICNLNAILWKIVNAAQIARSSFNVRFVATKSMT